MVAGGLSVATKIVMAGRNIEMADIQEMQSVSWRIMNFAAFGFLGFNAHGAMLVAWLA